MLKRTFIATSLLLTASFHSLANEGLIIERFGKRTLQDIKAERTNQPFLVVFWSKDCGYCVKEMDMLGNLAPENPDLEVVLISTDTNLDSTTAENLLAKTGLDVDRIWVFDKPFNDRMYASVDETWRGELPNTLFLNSKHEFQSVKGAVSEEMVMGWLEYVREEQPLVTQAPTRPATTQASQTAKPDVTVSTPSHDQEVVQQEQRGVRDRLGEWADSMGLF